MISHLRHWWQAVRASFWFVPALLVSGAVLLAIGLIAVDVSIDLNGAERWPLVFGAGADGARGLLTAVAGSMITVAGVVFSITIVALALTSSQYTSRVLRNFMRDRVNQTVLGVFVGIFAYCLVVLRTIRGGDEGAFVPALAVMGGLVLAFVGIAFLILFIHHISISIQASSILAAAARETIAAVDRLFPEEMGEGPDDDAHDSDATEPVPGPWIAVCARQTGYIQSVDSEALLELACDRQCVVRMERGIGEFVAEGSVLLSVAGLSSVDERPADDLAETYFIERQRSVEQDAGFGVRQIVDVALKALSPGINDSTTAIMCVNYLGAIIARLAGRRMPARHRMYEGRLCVIARGEDFHSLLGEAFDQIRQNASRHPAVLAAQMQALETIAARAIVARRKDALRAQIDLIISASRQESLVEHDRQAVDISSARLLHLLNNSR
jgi:uncharacterized membrane protein